MNDHIIWLNETSLADTDKVGGKNASLGEMISHLGSRNINIPGGFSTTAQAYREYLSANHLTDKINAALSELDVDNVTALAKTGAQIRQWILETEFSNEFNANIENAYATLIEQYSANAARTNITWAVRSSATAEDLPNASFAGQQETYLNVAGFGNIKKSIHKVFASLFNDRAIAYRVHQGFDHNLVAISAGVQKMVRSDIASSGVMFTLDTESGFRDVVLITGSYGLGEMVVQGAVNPDEFYVHKKNFLAGRPAILHRHLGDKEIQMVYSSNFSSPIKEEPVSEDKRCLFCLSDDEIQELAHLAIEIEDHYDRPMDIEWAKDGNDGKLYIVQARPETVQSRKGNLIERYALKERGEVLVEGRAIGNKIGSGKAKLISNIEQMDEIDAGDVLVTDMTDPDWEPIMNRASAIVTNRGGRTCHAAIIARELGVPAVVGCNNATDALTNNTNVTVSCAEGDAGFIYAGLLDFECTEIKIDTVPALVTKIMMNVGNPERAFKFSQIPNDGVGLARLEFVINQMVGIHPKALLDSSQLDKEEKQFVDARVTAYGDPIDFYVNKLAEGISTLAAAFYPKPVIVRTSDFKSNEYANLVGGKYFEPHEENPMIGFRGASRYISDSFRGCFELECQALKRVREDMGFDNVQIMIPFVRTIFEASEVEKLLANNGLRRGDKGLRVIMMCEIPSNVMLAEEFLEHFDGFSIGSNDLTQLTLGLDRDSGLVANGFNERDPAVKKMLHMAISTCLEKNKYVGICGQGPSDHPDFAKWLMAEGISSISLNPDTVIQTTQILANNQ